MNIHRVLLVMGEWYPGIFWQQRMGRYLSLITDHESRVTFHHHSNQYQANFYQLPLCLSIAL
jgi:hypothetical protein